MPGDLLKFLRDIAGNPGRHLVRVTEAMQKPPVSAVANRFRVATFCLFMAMALLFASAAIVHVTAGPGFASNFLGGCGVVSMYACAISGLCYERWNRQSDSSPNHRPETISD